MKMYRIEISSWTSSFRYPNLISGYQPTLDVPPISTVLGLINAAAGKYIEHQDLKIGYFFKYEMKANDLETIYQIEIKNGKLGTYPSEKPKSNVINREFLYDCKLYLYLQDSELVEYFKKPYFSLVLGRSGDLASVDSILEVNLIENNNSNNIKGQVIPFEDNYLAGEIQALPKYFTNTIPRKNIDTEPYSIISCYSKNNTNKQIKAYSDCIDGENVDIYIHNVSVDY